jgi:hypothetical protein
VSPCYSAIDELDRFTNSSLEIIIMDEYPHATAALRWVIDECPNAAQHQQLFRIVSIFTNSILEMGNI